MSVWPWLVYGLAVARVTGLIAADEISRPAREWIVEHLPLRPFSIALEYLLTCFWCVSMWVAAAVTAAAWHWGSEGWLMGPALALALSQIAGMTSALGRPAQTPPPADDSTATAVTP